MGGSGSTESSVLALLTQKGPASPASEHLLSPCDIPASTGKEGYCRESCRQAASKKEYSIKTTALRQNKGLLRPFPMS